MRRQILTTNVWVEQVADFFVSLSLRSFLSPLLSTSLISSPLSSPLASLALSLSSSGVYLEDGVNPIFIGGFVPVPEFGNIQIFCSIFPEFPHSSQNIHEDKFFGKNRISEACNIDSERKIIFCVFLRSKTNLGQ